MILTGSNPVPIGQSQVYADTITSSTIVNFDFKGLIEGRLTGEHGNIITTEIGHVWFIVNHQVMPNPILDCDRHIGIH